MSTDLIFSFIASGTCLILILPVKWRWQCHHIGYREDQILVPWDSSWKEQFLAGSVFPDSMAEFEEVVVPLVEVMVFCVGGQQCHQTSSPKSTHLEGGHRDFSYLGRW